MLAYSATVVRGCLQEHIVDDQAICGISPMYHMDSAVHDGYMRVVT